MTQNDRKQIINNAMNSYRYAKLSGDQTRIALAINEMENVLICVGPWSAEGTAKLRSATEELRALLSKDNNK